MLLVKEQHYSEGGRERRGEERGREGGRGEREGESSSTVREGGKEKEKDHFSVYNIYFCFPFL